MFIALVMFLFSESLFFSFLFLFFLGSFADDVHAGIWDLANELHDLFGQWVGRILGTFLDHHDDNIKLFFNYSYLSFILKGGREGKE